MVASRNLWKAVDAYFTETIVAPDRALEEALAANARAGLPSIDVSAPQGKLIHLLVRMSGARKALEIGALGGYSTIWLASALPNDGRLITSNGTPGMQRSRDETSPAPVLAAKSRSESARRWRRCRKSRPRGSARSILSSSTPTR
jgi:hypothetical protein